MPTLERKPEVSPGIRRIAGLLVLGLGLVLLADAVRSLIVDNAAARSSLWLLAFLLPVYLLAIQFGWRLLFNRPNSYGSIMGPMAWRICGLLILIVTGITAAVQLKSDGAVSLRLLWLLSIAGACVVKAEYMVKRGEITWDQSKRP
jgi:hypothetical protein